MNIYEFMDKCPWITCFIVGVAGVIAHCAAETSIKFIGLFALMVTGKKKEANDAKADA